MIAILLSKSFIYKSDTLRSGYQDEFIREPFTLIKRIELPGEIKTTPVIKNGKTVFGAASNAWTVDLKTGEILSNFPIDYNIESPSEFIEGVFIFATREGKIYGIREKTFEKLWEFDEGAQTTSSPLIYEDKLYILTGYPTSRLLVLNPFTGNYEWELKLGIPSHSSVLISSNICIIASNNGEVIALNILTKNILWRKKFNGSFRNATPCVINEYLFLVPGEVDMNIYKLNLLTGDILQEATITNTPFDPLEGRTKIFFAGGIVTDGSRIFVPYGNKESGYKLAVFDTNLNKLYELSKGSVEARDYLVAPTVAGDRLFLPGDDGLHIFDTSGNFIVSLENEAITGQVAVSDGYLVVPVRSGVSIYKASGYAALSNPSRDYEIVFGSVDIKGAVKGYSWEVLLNGVIISSGNYDIDDTMVLYRLNTQNLADGTHRITLKAANYDSDVYIKVKKSFARMEVGTESSTITANDGTTVTIPYGAINQEDLITIDDDFAQNPQTPGLFKTNIAKKLKFENPSTQLLLPIQVKVKVDDSKLIYSPGEVASKKHLKVMVNGSMVNASYENGYIVFNTTSTGNITVVEDRRIPKTGGSYDSYDGFEIRITPYAIPEDDYILKIKKWDNGYNSIKPKGFEPLPEAYEIKMASFNHFNNYVEVLIPANDSEIENLRPFYYDENEKIWKPFLMFETEGNKVKTWTNHFSIIKLFKYITTSEIITESKVYTYPNPAYGDEVVFKGYSGNSGRIKIKVFNVAAEKIYETEFDVKAYAGWQHIWNISRIASGIYIYVIEGTDTSGNKIEVKKKLAIIH